MVQNLGSKRCRSSTVLPREILFFQLHANGSFDSGLCLGFHCVGYVLVSEKQLKIPLRWNGRNTPRHFAPKVKPRWDLLSYLRYYLIIRRKPGYELKLAQFGVKCQTK